MLSEEQKRKELDGKVIQVEIRLLSFYIICQTFKRSWSSVSDDYVSYFYEDLMEIESLIRVMNNHTLRGYKNRYHFVAWENDYIILVE